jgi:xanthine dehydrogenase YagR molybdenum-binding subunit
MTDHVMDAAFRPAGLDRAVQGVLGRPIDRVEGPAKVSGEAL